MNIEFTARAAKDFAGLSPQVRAQLEKQLGFLCENLRHPSIRAKKYDEGDDIWQGRVNQGYRFYFRIVGSTYRILTIIPHPK